MEDIPNLAQYGWGGAAALIIGLLLLLFQRRARREDEAKAKAKAREEELVKAQAQWAAAIHRGDALEARRLKERIDAIRAAGLCLALSALVSCKAPEPRTVVLSEHCRAIMPGETVPPLPPGETTYWLCTPSGLFMLLPAGSAIPGREDGDAR